MSKQFWNKYKNKCSYPQREASLQYWILYFQVSPPGEEDIACVLSELSGGRIAEACKRAQEVGDHRLSLLIAQAAGATAPRHMLSKQMDQWRDKQACEEFFW